LKFKRERERERERRELHLGLKVNFLDRADARIRDKGVVVDR